MEKLAKEVDAAKLEVKNRRVTNEEQNQELR